MKVFIFSHNPEEIKPLIEKFGFEIVENNPEFVISYGGDGTLMKAEYKFPGIPKILLKGSPICKRCLSFSNEEILKRVKAGDYFIQELSKLEARVKGKTFLGINDITVHNKDSRHAIRYELWVNGQKIANEIIGDGVVLATPFGSTGYYRSITDSFFEVGIGLAFNNSTEQSDHMVLKDDSQIKIKIIRGPAVVYADNQEESIELLEGDEVELAKSEKIAKLVMLK